MSGLVTGACFAEFGVDVTCVDVDEEKIARLSEGRFRSTSRASTKSSQRTLQAGRLHFTTDIKAAVEQALVIFLAVGTPPKEDGSADLQLHRCGGALRRRAHERLQGDRHQIHRARRHGRASAPA